METVAKLHSQIAQEAGVPKDAAQVAAYILDLSRAGKTLDQAAQLMKRDRAFVRSVARDWDIPFPDYQPRPPIDLVWTKEKGGKLALRLGSETLALTRRNSSAHKGTDIAYAADWVRATPRIVEHGSTALIAAKRLSTELDRRAVELFGVDDIAVTFPDGAGGGRPFLPKRIGDPNRLRSSLRQIGVSRPA